MTRFGHWLPLVCLAALSCTDTPTQPPLRSLRGMSDAAMLCLAQADVELEPGEVPEVLPRPVDSCPDFNSDDDELRRLHALVTQPETGEVALVDVQRGRVVDAEGALPGITFLPVGDEPISVVSTPGGAASFVATREAGKPGLYALPTSCVSTRREEQPFVDITSWPACRLPATPGAMEVLIDPVSRTSCDAAPDGAALQQGVAASAQRSDCPADLAAELGPVGRRKLLVALPARGELALIDAQELLDRTPGSFDDCVIERTVPLQVSLPSPAPAQVIPADLPARAASCMPASPVGSLTGLTAHPADFALGDGRLYVADLAAPVVHVIDTHDPCAPFELPSLLPQSYSEPAAVVTTRRVALSPLTSKNERFVYAIEDSNLLTAGSVMVFDVSERSTQRTPLVREGAQRIPQEPPDRIQFEQEAADVEFVVRSLAAFDPVTGVSVDQLACDPLQTDRTAPSAQFQPSTDLTSGAGPRRLHGTFAFIALYGGQLAVVDVDDLDAACRRPVAVNPGSSPNFRGCAEDPNVAFDSPLTVSNEISCGVVQPHRARSSTYFLNDARRGRAAALRQFPRLTSGSGRPLPTDQSENGKNHPMLLAVDFSANEPAEVFVGSTLYERSSVGTNELIIDPARAERSSLALSLVEPRQFFPNEQFSLTFEGSLGIRGSARIVPRGARALLDEGVAGRFCTHGIQDLAATERFAQQFFPQGASAATLEEFIAPRADYVQLTGELPREQSEYWQSAEGNACGTQLPSAADDVTPLSGRRFCELWFGTPQAPTLRRDLRVQEAYQNSLWVEPRFGGEDPETLLELVGCCFPEITDYTVRAGQQWVLRGTSSGFAHSMTADSHSGRCVESCDPVVQGRSSRVLEISCAEDCPLAGDGLPVIGLASTSLERGRDLACVVDDPRGGVGADQECVLARGATRFAIYRGREPSTRDMQFNWQLRGGFAPLTIVLSRANNSLPERLRFIPSLETLMVVDGGTAGLGFVSLATLLNRPVN